MDRTEIREDIYRYLKDNRAGRQSEAQLTQNLQINSIWHLAQSRANGTNTYLDDYMDVFSELINLGIIAMRDATFFFITKLGNKFLDDEDYDVHDPDCFLENFIDAEAITLEYIKESIISTIPNNYFF